MVLVKLTDLRIYSASWTLPKLLILRSSGDRFRPQNPRILLNLTVPVLGARSLLSEHNLWSLQYRVLETISYAYKEFTCEVDMIEDIKC